MDDGARRPALARATIEPQHNSSPIDMAKRITGRPVKPDADKERSKTWRCSLLNPSVAQLRTMRSAGRDHCNSTLCVRRFAMDVQLTDDRSKDVLQAFFVFGVRKRRHQLEQQIMPDAAWSAASYRDWPKVAGTFKEIRDFTHQGSRAPASSKPSSVPAQSACSSTFLEGRRHLWMPLPGEAPFRAACADSMDEQQLQFSALNQVAGPKPISVLASGNDDLEIVPHRTQRRPIPLRGRASGSQWTTGVLRKAPRHGTAPGTRAALVRARGHTLACESCGALVDLQSARRAARQAGHEVIEATDGCVACGRFSQPARHAAKQRAMSLQVLRRTRVMVVRPPTAAARVELTMLSFREARMFVRVALLALERRQAGTLSAAELRVAMPWLRLD